MLQQRKTLRLILSSRGEQLGHPYQMKASSNQVV